MVVDGVVVVVTDVVVVVVVIEMVVVAEVVCVVVVLDVVIVEVVVIEVDSVGRAHSSGIPGLSVPAYTASLIASGLEFAPQEHDLVFGLHPHRPETPSMSISMHANAHCCVEHTSL